MSPRPSIAEERRPQILEAAAHVIADRGFDGMRLSDVADRAGLSVGTVQHYFGSREALLVAAFRHIQATDMERWYAAAAAQADVWQRLVALIESASTSGERFRERWTLWLEYWTMCLRDAELRREAGRLHVAWTAPIREAIELGEAEGRFRLASESDGVVDRLLALMDGLALQALLEIPETTRQRMRDLLVETLARELGVDRDGRPSGPNGQPPSATATVSPSSGTR